MMLHPKQNKKLLEKLKHTNLSEPSYGITLLNDCKYGVSEENGRCKISVGKKGNSVSTKRRYRVSRAQQSL